MLKYDTIDLRMMEGLGIYGPRNITRLARKLNISPETLRNRLRRIRSQIVLYTNVYCTNLGLKKAVVSAQAIPGYEQLLFDCLKMNDFWMYVNRCYGVNEGCLGIYSIPKDHALEFEDFISELEKLRIANDIKISWSTCFQQVHTRCNWFNFKDANWIFPWDEWISEIPTETTQLPYTLIDPQDYPIMADETDVFIIKELEKDPTVNLTDLATKLGISQQLAEYHYRKHVLARQLLESFDVLDFRFDINASDMFFFFLTFDSWEKLARLASSLLDKPFALGLGKVLGENGLIAHVYLPKLEFRNFVDALSKLISMGFLQSYRYIILDLGKGQRQTISYEYFKNGAWIYDHNKHIQNLRSLVQHKNDSLEYLELLSTSSQFYE
jgi:DNA-binding Lrp family transcriptional regulator